MRSEDSADVNAMANEYVGQFEEYTASKGLLPISNPSIIQIRPDKTFIWTHSDIVGSNDFTTRTIADAEGIWSGGEDDGSLVIILAIKKVNGLPKTLRYVAYPGRATGTDVKGLTINVGHGTTAFKLRGY